MLIKAAPNHTNSELDAKQVVNHQDSYYNYLKRQYHLACNMEDDYNEPE